MATHVSGWARGVGTSTCVLPSPPRDLPSRRVRCCQRIGRAATAAASTYTRTASKLPTVAGRWPLAAGACHRLLRDVPPPSADAARPAARPCRQQRRVVGVRGTCPIAADDVHCETLRSARAWVAHQRRGVGTHRAALAMQARVLHHLGRVRGVALARDPEAARPLDRLATWHAEASRPAVRCEGDACDVSARRTGEQHLGGGSSRSSG